MDQATPCGTALFRIAASSLPPARLSMTLVNAAYLGIELIHSTGHESRLARKGVTETDGFGGKEYSQEELVAEMGAAFLGMEAGIVRDEHEQSAAYLKGWLDTLRVQEHRRWIVQAANQASRATDFVLGREAVDSFAAPATDESSEASALPNAA